MLFNSNKLPRPHGVDRGSQKRSRFVASRRRGFGLSKERSFGVFALGSSLALVRCSRERLPDSEWAGMSRLRGMKESKDARAEEE